MHLLVVAMSFPSPNDQYPGNFIGKQVRMLAERVEKITVLSPVPRVPPFAAQYRRFAANATLPVRYWMIPGRCEVRFPRYIKAPGDLFLSWTTIQWCRIVSNTVRELNNNHQPVSIIHANAGTVSGWSGIQAARKYRIPSVVTYQGSEVHVTLANRQKGWKLCRDSFRLADLNISVSRSLENILKQAAEPQGRSEVLLRGVDQKIFFPPKEGIKKPIVLFVGRIAKLKGIFELLTAWDQVIAACPKAELRMVGHDHTNGQFLRDVCSRGYGASIKLTGLLPGNDVAALMRQAQILCLPSHGEGTPNCIMEAVACGLPVVATKVGGISDIVQDNRSGILVEKEDSKALGTALVSLLLDKARRERMGAAGYEYAQKHLNSKNNSLRLIELYSELLTARAIA